HLGNSGSTDRGRTVRNGNGLRARRSRETREISSVAFNFERMTHAQLLLLSKRSSDSPTLIETKRGCDASVGQDVMMERRMCILKGSAFASSAPAIVRASSLLPALAATDGWTQGGGDIYPTGPSLRLKPGREFAVNSWVHTRLAPDAPLDPNSATIVANFNRILRDTATVTAMENGGPPIYIAPPNQPTCRIKVTGTTEKDLWLQTKMNDVPIPTPDTFTRQECPE